MAPPLPEGNRQHGPSPLLPGEAALISDCLNMSDWTQFESDAGTDDSSDMSSWVVDISSDESGRLAGESSSWEDLRSSPCSEDQGLSLTATEAPQAPLELDPLENAVVARHGNGNFGQRDVKFVDYFWTDDITQTKSIEIRWNLPGGHLIDLPLLKTTWGRVVEVELPPYACDNTTTVISEVGHFLDQGNTAIISKYKSTIIDLALRIRSGSYCSQGWGSITGPESLGINAVDFNEFGECGYAAYDRGKDVPLPLSIDHQFDVALLLIIKKHQDKLVKTLSKMIKVKGQKPWYEIFLAVFVMLSNLEYVHTGSYTFYEALKQTKFQSSVYSLAREMIDEFTYSAENILYHFCHILKGKLGFKMARENMSELKNRQGLDDESVTYITTVLELLPKTRTIMGDPVPPPPGQLVPPDGRWLIRLFDRIKG
ncbi:hypothetical protein ONZ43_g3141 [Nemania bipapillata]|uniref:Uncharacterized protein n=1 Tax=Nemania bipapillata TaxID=110536 RepID=A0ACC2IY65_9PEZI|nr:hypothetical protein ONZ43_g3141 [Nemania bipapillata]